MPLLLDAAAHCTPRHGSEHRLPTETVSNALSRQLPDWTLTNDANAITRTFRFPDYYHTMAFVNALAHIAHREDHHPDLSVHYDRVVVQFSTHDVGGLSENDLLCAFKTDALIK